MKIIKSHFDPYRFEITQRRFDQRMEDLEHFSLLHDWDTCRLIARELENLAATLRDTENRMADEL